MISLLIALIVLVVVICIIRLLLPMLGLPQPINTAVLLVIGLLGFLWLIGQLGYSGVPHLSLR